MHLRDSGYYNVAHSIITTSLQYYTRKQNRLNYDRKSKLSSSNRSFLHRNTLAAFSHQAHCITALHRRHERSSQKPDPAWVLADIFFSLELN